MRQIFANLHPNLWLNELFKEATGLSFQLGDAWDVANGSASAPKAEPNWGQKELIMRADQRRSLHRTILTAAVLPLSASRTTRVRVRKKIKKIKNKTKRMPRRLSHV